MLLQNPPLSLYVHLPWCIKKCPYCDFNSHALRGDVPEAAYIDALLADLDQELPDVWGRMVTSIFIGGGTPSLFSAQSLDRLISGLRARLNLFPDIEITLEANPGTFEQQRFKDYRALGINRLSLGIQSFKQESLLALGRVHGAKEARIAAEQAHTAGFDNLNLDLMFALPGQDLDDAMLDLDTAMACEPVHISYYQLTLEPNTLFYTQPPVLPEDELIWQMQLQAQSKLAAGGYEQYEISAYAKNEQTCKHNLNYWRFGDYLGIGAGAHGKLSLPAEDKIIRRCKQRQPLAYMQVATNAERIVEEKELNEQDLAFEFMLNALRLSNGVPAALFNNRTGLSTAKIESQLKLAEEKGLLDRSRGQLLPTELGRRFLNDLLSLFM